MLEQQDLDLIEKMMCRVMKSVIQENNEMLFCRIDESIEKNNEMLFCRIDESIEKAIEKNNEMLFRRIEESIEKAIEKNNEMLFRRIEESIEKAIEKNNEMLFCRIDESIARAIEKSEAFLLDEMERYHQATQREIEKLSRKVDEIAEFYRIKKLEENTSDILLKLYRKQQDEINEIKERLAM